jgi:hypothetical protein
MALEVPHFVGLWLGWPGCLGLEREIIMTALKDFVPPKLGNPANPATEQQNPAL